VKNIGKPDAGKLHVRFDEGGQGKPVLYSTHRRPQRSVWRLNIFFVTGEGRAEKELAGRKKK